MRIAKSSFIAHPAGRQIILYLRDDNGERAQQNYTRGTFESQLTYLKGLRDALGVDETIKLERLFGLSLNKAEVGILVTYLKGVRDGRGWNR